jgi:hypothetical protein
MDTSIPPEVQRDPFAHIVHVKRRAFEGPRRLWQAHRRMSCGADPPQPPRVLAPRGPPLCRVGAAGLGPVGAQGGRGEDVHPTLGGRASVRW